jgi:hypothetical protein
LRFGIVGAALVAGVAWAQDTKLQVGDPWMRALPNRLPAAGYFTLRNDGDTPVELVGAASPACGKLMLHRTVSAGGTERMEMVARIDIPAHGTIAFSPGGFHLMCTMPTTDVAPGMTVPVTLEFKDGSPLRANFNVRNAAGK